MAHSLSVSLPPMECLLAAFAAARLGSFSAAAAELGVTHATISRRVAGAESWAGTKLFDRHGRGVQPTPNGQQLLIRLAQALDQMNAVVDRERAPRRRPVVRLGVTPTFARYWLLPRLAALERDDLQIDVVAELRAADLEHGEVDLAIRYGRGGWNFEHEEALFDEHVLPVASPAAFPGFARAEPEEILELPLLFSNDTRLWRGWCAHHELRLHRKPADRALTDTALVLEAAVVGLGATLWLTSLGPMDKVPAGLVARPDLMAPAPLRYHLVMRAPRPGGPAARLAERIRAAVRESATPREAGRLGRGAARAPASA
jgi:DNA-binding transcriptional LysR family regulator